MFSVTPTPIANFEQDVKKHLETIPLSKINTDQVRKTFRGLSSEEKDATSFNTERLFNAKINLYSRNLRVIKSGWYYKIPLIVGVVGLIFAFLLRQTMNPFGISATGVDGDLITSAQFFSYIALCGGIIGRILQTPVSEGTEKFVEDLKKQLRIFRSVFEANSSRVQTSAQTENTPPLTSDSN